MKVALLAGGVGGGRMADGFYQHCGPDLKVIVNTGDDFEMHGLSISPDLDSVLYTLAGISNVEQGWGLAQETFSAHEMMGRLGMPDWFLLGDKDLGIHISRSHWLREGQSLTEVTARLAKGLGVAAVLLPMSDQKVSTWVELADGRSLSFQDYFVKRRHADNVSGFTFKGIQAALPGVGVLPALQEAVAVILAPSNPFVSIDPILKVAGVRDAITTTSKPRIAISPIIGGEALKGPAGTMLKDMGHETSCRGIAKYYEGLIDGIVIDTIDQGYADSLQKAGLKVLCTDTIMRDPAGRSRLASIVLHWLEEDFL